MLSTSFHICSLSRKALTLGSSWNYPIKKGWEEAMFDTETIMGKVKTFTSRWKWPQVPWRFTLWIWRVGVECFTLVVMDVYNNIIILRSYVTIFFVLRRSCQFNQSVYVINVLPASWVIHMIFYELRQQLPMGRWSSHRWIMVKCASQPQIVWIPRIHGIMVYFFWRGSQWPSYPPVRLRRLNWENLWKIWLADVFLEEHLFF